MQRQFSGDTWAETIIRRSTQHPPKLQRILAKDSAGSAAFCVDRRFSRFAGAESREPKAESQERKAKSRKPRAESREPKASHDRRVGPAGRVRQARQMGRIPPYLTLPGLP